MQEKVSLEKLKGVSETLLLPLRGRYLETKRKNGIINDPKSVEIVDSIDHDFSINELPWDGQIMFSARTEILDQATTNFLKENPNSVIVNLGCGLDTRCHRVDNGRMLWYDLDLPECIEIRKNFFRETARFKFIAKSVLDFSWIDEVVKNKSVLFIAEGLLNYFTEEDVKRIVLTIKDNFPNAEFIFEAHSSLIVKSWHKHASIKGAFSMFKWGIKSGKVLEKWDNGIRFLQEWHYLDRYPKRWKWIRFFRFIPSVRKTMKVVHIKFNPQLN